MPLMPGDVAVVPNPDNVIGTTRPVGSLAWVIDRTVNPGFPFWIAGIEDIVGQRPTSPRWTWSTRRWQRPSMRERITPS